ncbi:MAG: hypothetical protein IPL49_20760 [Saprospirales bacterium]|nr:hypothetical protein [Saprospirales bacterium]MBK8493244.1 hypothetical protein [Saprospirales bacterium]
MQKITSSTDLRDAILQLESRQAEEGKTMKTHFYLAYENVKPINLIKSTFMEVVESQDLTDNLISTAAGLTAGYLSKTLFVGESHSPLKKLLGSVLMYGITNFVAKHPDDVKSVGGAILNLIKSMPWDGIPDAEKNGAKQPASRN